MPNSQKIVGVLGAGTMGVGIAHVFAEHGYKVFLVDNNTEVLNQLNKALTESYKIQRMLGNPRDEITHILQRIEKTSDIAKLKQCEFIVENTPENYASKEQLFSEIKNFISDHTIVAINTSCIPISSLNALINIPSNMLGIHFMNPVPLKSKVEIIRAERTTDNVLDRAKQILGAIGKSGIVVKDSPGFVINRVFMVTVNEAIKTFEEQLCSTPKEIDDLFVHCLGFKMGPLMTADLIGLDTILYSLEVLEQKFKEKMYKPANLLIDLVKVGKLGKKSGSGLYEYVKTR